MNAVALSELRAPRVSAILLGGSAGGIEAVSTLLAALPERLDVPVLVSLHIKADSKAHWPLVFRASRVPVIELRASIVIGSGSLSYEMVRALVERLPVMVCPAWVRMLAQPIGIEDVLAYLVAADDLPRGLSRTYEIGGPDVVTYADLMKEYARQRGLRRLLIPVPLLTPRLSGLWLGLVTPVQARAGRALVDGVRNATIVSGAGIPPFTGDIGINTTRAVALRDGVRTLVITPRIADLGDLRVFGTLEDVDATGLTATPDLRSLFINIQHPGEPANERSNPDQPLAISRWPDGTGRPRSATVVITKDDGGVIGT